MARRNAPKRIPLNNDNRDVIKAGIYGCCGNEWMRPYYDDCVEVCNICRDIVIPISLDEEWRQRWFGHFKCTAKTGKSKKPCGRTWTSSWTWTVDNQIQTTKCKACNSSTMPYQLDEIEKRDSDDEDDGPPHPQHLCSMCQRLGEPCNKRRRNRRFRTDSRYENDLSQAMRRMNFGIY